MSITDTPGMLWPKIIHDSDGLMLAASHAVGRNAVIDEDVAVFLASILLERYPTLIPARYGFAVEDLDAVGVVESIARKRGCYLKVKGRNKGELDLEKAAMLFLTDYRDGVLGRISLETPESRHAMLAAAVNHVSVAIESAEE